MLSFLNKGRGNSKKTHYVYKVLSKSRLEDFSKLLFNDKDENDKNDDISFLVLDKVLLKVRSEKT